MEGWGWWAGEYRIILALFFSVNPIPGSGTETFQRALNAFQSPCPGFLPAPGSSVFSLWDSLRAKGCPGAEEQTQLQLASLLAPGPSVHSTNIDRGSRTHQTLFQEHFSRKDRTKPSPCFHGAYSPVGEKPAVNDQIMCQGQ